MAESMRVKLAEFEKQVRTEAEKDKSKDDRISQLVKELASERAALNESMSEVDQVRQQLEGVRKQNPELQGEKHRISAHF